MRGIPIDILRAFVAVVEAKGFTRAAEELGRTQPTISLQVKRLEELLEAPLFKKGGRFELSGVGEVCFDYGKRLLRLHDDMLDELGRSNPNDAMRVGMPSEFAPVLAPRLDELRADVQVPTAFEVIVDSSQALSTAFRQNALDVAFVVGTGESEPHRIEQWRGQLRWFGRRTSDDEQDNRPLPIVLPPQGSPFHEAAIGALRAQQRRFEIVCTCSNFAVLAAAAAAGLGVTPMIDGLAPQGLDATYDKNLPLLPEITLLLLARSQTLALASRRWVANVVEALQSE